MAELWRYQDRLAAGLLTKRPRAEPDNVLLQGSAGYGRADFRFDERDARLLDNGLDYGKAASAYSSIGRTGTDIAALGDGTLLGAGVTGRVPSLGFSGLEDPRLSGIDPGLLKGALGLDGAAADILSKQATLFVEGLPLDCKRREAAHIFRHFRGFKEVRLVKKNAKPEGEDKREKGDKRDKRDKGEKKEKGEKIILCFADFEDAYSAMRAFVGLRGYKVDEDDPECKPLQLQFSEVPQGVRRQNRRSRRR